MIELEPISIDNSTFLREHCALPALPEVVNKVQQKLYDSNVEISEISDLLSGDPALIAQVLKVVNSAHYSLPWEITKVRVAIALIGLNEIYKMFLSLSVIKALKIEDEKEIKEFWFHSFYTAIISKYLAKKFEPHISLEELWSTSILHDIGKLVYLKYFPQHYKVLKEYCREKGVLFHQAEEIFEMPPSSILGSLLCDYWRLPNKIKNTCEIHTIKDLNKLEGSKSSVCFTRISCLGNLLAILANDELCNEIKKEIAEVTKKELDCDEDVFLTIMGDIYELKSDVESFMKQMR